MHYMLAAILVLTLIAASIFIYAIAWSARRLRELAPPSPSSGVETLRKLPLYVNGQKVDAATVTMVDFDREVVRLSAEVLIGVGDMNLISYMETGEEVELDVVIDNAIFRSVGHFEKCSMVYDYSKGGALRGTFKFLGNAFSSSANCYVKNDGAPHLTRVNGEILPVVASADGVIRDAETKLPISLGAGASAAA